MKKITDANIYSDCVKIEKYTGKPDYFSMDAGEARLVVLLIEKLRVVTTGAVDRTAP